MGKKQIFTYIAYIYLTKAHSKCIVCKFVENVDEKFRIDCFDYFGSFSINED